MVIIQKTNNGISCISTTMYGSFVFYLLLFSAFLLRCIGKVIIVYFYRQVNGYRKSYEKIHEQNFIWSAINFFEYFKYC